MTHSAKLHSLVESFKPKTQTPSNQVITKQIETVRKAIDGIQGVIADPTHSTSYILKGYLESISNFFRSGKFTTSVLPVLKVLESEDPKLWKSARIIDTDMPLTPIGFEGLRKSSAEVTDSFGGVSNGLCIEREQHLLLIYNISLVTIGKTFRILDKNSKL